MEIVETYEDYILTCVCLQQQESYGNFVNITPHQKKKYLNEILKINVYVNKNKTIAYAGSLIQHMI